MDFQAWHLLIFTWESHSIQARQLVRLASKRTCTVRTAMCLSGKDLLAGFSALHIWCVKMNALMRKQQMILINLLFATENAIVPYIVNLIRFGARKMNLSWILIVVVCCCCCCAYTVRTYLIIIITSLVLNYGYVADTWTYTWAKAANENAYDDVNGNHHWCDSYKQMKRMNLYVHFNVLHANDE